uniref:Uncharacterized mitochondrial protein AtMg00810-like n=1 Tax=Tanacetum cinerariifolium TaxID=118510 RepID=A0A6L2L0K9_TANCI|nr:uncharacterized mitochondrial protein AtMg00810-like [Tanacetum cinerariifolium]
MIYAQKPERKIYSASVVDIAVDFCFLDDQLTSFLPKNCALPDVHFHESWQPAWSASARAVRLKSVSLEYHRPILMVPFRGALHVYRGIWYPKDSSVSLTSFTDADHAGCQDTRRSTSGSVQFLGERLISWSSKRQKSAAISRLWQPQLSNKWRWMRLLFPALKGSVHPKEKQGELALCQGRLLVLNDQGTPKHTKNTMLLPLEKQHLSQRSVPEGKRVILTLITPPTATATPKPTVAATPRLTVAAKGKQPVKATKAKSPSALLEVAMTEAKQLKLVLKRSRQQMHISQSSGSGIDEGTGSKPGVLDVPTYESEEELSWNSSDDEGVDDQGKDRDDDKGDEGDKSDEEEEDADEDKDGDERDDDEENQEVAKSNEQDDAEGGGDDEEEGDGEKDQGLNINEEEYVEDEEEDELYRDVNINQGRGLQASLEVKDSHVTLTLVKPDGMESIFVTASSSVASLLTSTPIITPSTIATITTISQAPIFATPIPSEVLQNLPTFALVFCFDDRLKSLEANFSEFRQTNPFAEAVSAIPVFADLSKMELKKIIIEKMEGNKSIQETVILKRRSDDDDDKGEGPSARSDRGSKRRREGKEHESASAPLETATRSAGKSTTGSKSRQASASESALAEEPVQTTSQIKEPSHSVFEKGAEDQPIVQSSQHPKWFSQPQKPLTSDRDRNKTLPALRVDTLTPQLLAGPTYELIKGSCKSLIELEYHLEEVYKATTDQLDWFNPKGQQYPHNLLQPLPLIPDNRGRRVIQFAHFINNDLEYLRGGAFSRKYTTSAHPLGSLSLGRKHQQFYSFTVNRESARDVYSKRMIIDVTDLKSVEWHSYKHLDWISVRRDDDKIYKFKEGDFKRLRLQDIKDMLLLLVQGKLSNLTIQERFAFNKRLSLTKPDTYQSDLKRREAYTAYSNPRGFIYQNKDKKNRLMRIDELYKFSDGTLNDVCIALNDRLKGIRMQYLPQTIWRKGDKDRAAAMIQAIDKMLKTRRIMRSLEKFVGRRLYEGDFRMLQRTI